MTLDFNIVFMPCGLELRQYGLYAVAYMGKFCLIITEFPGVRCVYSRAKVTGPYEVGRVLDGSAHLLSRALVSQSASVACCTVTVRRCQSLHATRRCKS
jgi:hypothetical protein